MKENYQDQTLLLALGKVCGVPTFFLFFGVSSLLSLSFFGFPFVPILQGDKMMQNLI